MAYPIRILTPRENAAVAHAAGDEYTSKVLNEIARRKDSIRTSQTRFSELCDRFDNLYYANEHTRGGADHWPEDPNRKIKGKVHVSVNVHPTYVDVPAALQAVPPIENITPLEESQESRDVASLVERLYFRWKETQQFEIKSHKVATIKSLYGRAAVKVVWDDDEKMPEVTLVEQPRNLWLGWRSTDYSKLEWAIYSYLISAEEAVEEYGLDMRINSLKDDEYGRESKYLYAVPTANSDVLSIPNHRDWLLGVTEGMLEVNEYWYRCPAGDKRPEKGKRTKMVTHRIITVGNCIVEDDDREEYGDMIPYIPVFNTYIPGLPDGRSDLNDVEQILREKDERISAGGTMIAKTVGGQFWQLTGPEAPDRIPTNMRVEANKIAAPGAGNRIEAITPWMPEFQLEAYLTRLDRELQDISGLNDLLRGLAPAQVLSSSKAINALVANYEARITLRRALFYQWRTDVWEMVKKVWAANVSAFEPVFEIAGRLVIKAPSLTPRDDLEMATMALNLMNGKVWAQERAMDATGVEDPEREQHIIQMERRIVEMFPQDVQAQAALAATLQQIQMQGMQMQQQMPQQGQSPEDGDAAAMEAEQALRDQGDRATPGGTPMMNGAGEQGVPPQGASAFQGGPGFNAVNQTMLMEGQPTNRLLLQQPLSDQPEG